MEGSPPRAAPGRALPHQAPDLRLRLSTPDRRTQWGQCWEAGRPGEPPLPPGPCGPLPFLPRQAATVRAFLGMLPPRGCLYVPLLTLLKPTHQSSSHCCCQVRTTWDRAELQSKIPGPWDRKRQEKERPKFVSLVKSAKSHVHTLSTGVKAGAHPLSLQQAAVVSGMGCVVRRLHGFQSGSAFLDTLSAPGLLGCVDPTAEASVAVNPLRVS